MIRKTVVAAIAAGLLTLGAASTAPAEPVPPVPPEWIPLFYFGTQTHCMQAGATGTQLGALPPGTWKCDSGWLMVRPPQTG